jgi:DNA-binding transcriptional LysR family regulator
MIESFRYFLAPVIFNFKKSYPDIRIKLEEMGPEHIEESLKTYDIHIGITSQTNNNKEYIYDPIFQERYVIITPLDHPFEHLSQVGIRELKDEMFIHSLEGFDVRNIFIKACQEAGFTPNYEYEAESLETIHSLVEIGLGISIVPESFLQRYPSNKTKIIYLNDDFPKRTVFFVYYADRFMLPAIKDFMRIATEHSNLMED